jgi:hypothetical protein
MDQKEFENKLTEVCEWQYNNVELTEDNRWDYNEENSDEDNENNEEIKEHQKEIQVNQDNYKSIKILKIKYPVKPCPDCNKPVTNRCVNYKQFNNKRGKYFKVKCSECNMYMNPWTKEFNIPGDFVQDVFIAYCRPKSAESESKYYYMFQNKDQLSNEDNK